MNTPSEFHVQDIGASGERWRPRRTTDFGARLESADLGRAIRFNWTSKDGFPAHGYVTLPPDHERLRPVPLIVSLHGGPGVPWENRFASTGLGGPHPWPPLVLAAHGYAVYQPSTRGDYGHAKPNRDALLNHGGSEFALDIQAGIDSLRNTAGEPVRCDYRRSHKDGALPHASRAAAGLSRRAVSRSADEILIVLTINGATAQIFGVGPFALEDLLPSARTFAQQISPRETQGAHP